MKTLLALLTLLSAPCALHAGDAPEAPTHIKFIYSAADKQRTEAETDALLCSSSAFIPLVTPQLKTWICSASVDFDAMTADFFVTDPERLQQLEGGKTTPVELLNLKTPLKSGQEILLVKNTIYTLSVILTLPNTPDKTPEATAQDAETPAKDAEAPATAEPAKRWLTEEEIKKLEIVFPTTPQQGATWFGGHNPFETPVRGGLLEVTIPASGDQPEIKRAYQVSFNAEPLADFGAQAQMNLPTHAKPQFVLKKLWFAR